MKTSLSKFFSLSLLIFTGAASAVAQDITCALDAGAQTLNGIRSLHYVREPRLVGRVAIVRDGIDGVTVRPASFSNSELHWNELENQPRGTNYSVDDYLSLRRSKDGQGASTFALVKTRITLSGPNCDGSHMCDYSAVEIARAPIACVDSDDSIVIPPGEYHCNPSVPGDCE